MYKRLSESAYAILLFLMSISGVSQNLQGEFVHSKNMVTSTFTFKDNTFQRSSGIALNHEVSLSKGTLKIQNDTVYLDYTPWTDKSLKSNYQVLSRESLEPNSLMLHISAFDADEKVIREPLIYRLKSKDSVIAGFLLKDTNEITYIDGDKSVTEIIISGFSHRAVSIPLSEFQGDNSNLKVTLVVYDHTDYIDSNRTEKYFWDRKAGILYFINDQGQRGIEYRRSER